MIEYIGSKNVPSQNQSSDEDRVSNSGWRPESWTKNCSPSWVFWRASGNSKPFSEVGSAIFGLFYKTNGYAVSRFKSRWAEKKVCRSVTSNTAARSLSVFLILRFLMSAGLWKWQWSLTISTESFATIATTLSATSGKWVVCQCSVLNISMPLKNQ